MIGWAATGWSASVVKLGITSSLYSRVMFDASRYTDVIRRGSAILPAFLDIVAAFALFRRSAINLLISRHYSARLDFDL